MENSPTKLGVHLKVKSISNSLNFYKAFEFEPIFAYGSDSFLSQFKNIKTVSENYNGVDFKIGDALLELAEGHLAVKPEVFKEEINSSKVSIFLDVKSIDKVRETALNKGFEIAAEIREFPWGTREIVIKDPDGFIVVFREFIKK
ncbi:MAG: hypothetical protein Fur003_3870 [Candidatus Dojkabacteria bacterium]